MMDIIAHTMAYARTQRVHSPLRLRSYASRDYDAYRALYNDCFRDMRTALGRFPIDCCESKEALEKKKEDIFLLEIDGRLVGSVAIYESEIDDLIVARDFRRRGYGEALLRYAVCRLHSRGMSPIVLHVADWNQGAMALYRKNGFEIVKTQIVP